MATLPQPYHRVEFAVHVGGKVVPVKLALKPDSTISDALAQLCNVWSADSSKQSILTPNEMAVMDSEGFWLPAYSPVNCVLKINDKVSVYRLNKRGKDFVQDDSSKKRKPQNEENIVASTSAVQVDVASPKKKAKQDIPESKKSEAKVQANDVQTAKEESKRKKKKEKKKEKEKQQEKITEHKAAEKKSSEKKPKEQKAENKAAEKKIADKKPEEKNAEDKAAERRSDERKAIEKKDAQKMQSAEVVLTEAATEESDQSDAAESKRKRVRRARQHKRELKQHAEADNKVTVEPSSTQEDIIMTEVDSSEEVQVTGTNDQAAEISEVDAPSAGSIGDEESNGQASSEESEPTKVSQTANYLQVHAGLLDTIAGSVTDSASASMETGTAPDSESKKQSKKEQLILERKEKAAAKQEEAKRKKEEREREQARKKAEKEAEQAKRKQEALKKKEANKQKRAISPVSQSTESSASTQEDNCKNEVNNKLVPSFMPSNRGPSLADIMKNSKDIIQKSIYGTANKKQTTSTQSKPTVEKKPPTKEATASKDSDSDSNSDDEDNSDSALNHLTSWMDEMQQPRETL